MLRRVLSPMLAILLFALFHEGFHILVAVPFGEYRDFLVKPYGFEVLFQTPTGQRTGVEWLFISGTSNVVTIRLGYPLLSQRRKVAQMVNRELVAQKLPPVFGVQTKHPLFIPWFKRGKGQEGEMLSKP